MSSVIRCHDVDMGYGRTVVLPRVSLEVAAGQVLGVLGPNGAGKTTLLKTLLGILPPVRGGMAYGADLRFGYVPQRQVMDETYPLTVAEVVMMGRYGRIGPGRRPRATDITAVEKALVAVGLQERRHVLYRELSGGQKQRTLVARALAGDPTVLVLDEPTTDMDLASERAMIELIANLRRRQHLTVLVVSHVLYVVLSLADAVALVNAHVQVYPAHEARSPDRLSAFYGRPVQVADVNGVCIAV